MNLTTHHTRLQRIVISGTRRFLIDVTSDHQAANPWAVAVDEIIEHSDGSTEYVDNGPSANCFDLPLEQCNGESLLAYWTPYVEVRGHTF